LGKGVRVRFHQGSESSKGAPIADQRGWEGLLRKKREGAQMAPDIGGERADSHGG